MTEVRGDKRYSLSCRGTILLLLAAMLVVSLPGCSGCLTTTAQKKQDDEEEKKKEAERKKKPKPDFDVFKIHVQPHDRSTTTTYVKPAHWMSTMQVMRANNFDFPGGAVQSETTDTRGRPLDIANTPFRMSISRPISLPKGQARMFETTFYIHPRVESSDRKVLLSSKLRSARGGRLMTEQSYATLAMPSYQYYFVVLAPEADRYGFIKQLHCVRPPFDVDLMNPDDRILYYRVILPEVDRAAPLPSNPLTWTPIAFILWDGIDPDALSPAQQTCLLDWLHFGGQIIVSGPESLDRLKDSFLAPYMPAERVRTFNFRQSDFDEMNAYWAVPSAKKNNQLETLTILEENPPVGVELKLHPRARFVNNTGNLVAERRVGRGRVVVTSFALSSRQIRSWDCFDGFFNSALLRRPHRKFDRQQGEFDAQLSAAGAFWADEDLDEKDSRFSSTLRYFSRDVSPVLATDGGQASRRSDWHLRGYSEHEELNSGVGGWNDRSGAAESARASLGVAAGISIPRRRFVLNVLAVYLVILVPLNWLVFRLMGRVEWAWVAAPLIAIIGAVAVIKLAQLDIGFARSRTEVGVLEAHADHPRAHLTRYSALYTSLSSSYDLTFDDPHAIAMPFHGDASQRSARAASRSLDLNQDSKGANLDGLYVDSAVTRAVHTEQMFDLGGSFQLLRDQTEGSDDDQATRVRNATRHVVRGAIALRKTTDTETEKDVIEVAWIGDIAPQTVTGPLEFRRVGDESTIARQWEEAVETRTGSRKGELNIRQMLNLAAGGLWLEKGEIRLVGWNDEDLPGMVVRPGAAQLKQCTMLLVHLQRAPLPPARPDLNLISDVQDEDEERQEEDAVSDAADPGDRFDAILDGTR